MRHRKWKRGESVIVNTPSGRLQGTILRVSPEQRECVVRLADGVEMITETRFLGTVGKTPIRCGLFRAETDPKMPPDKRMRMDSINAFFEHQAQWVARNFGDTPGTWQAINHILLARSYVYTASMDKDYTQGWGVRIEELEAKLAESEKFASQYVLKL